MAFISSQPSSVSFQILSPNYVTTEPIHRTSYFGTRLKPRLQRMLSLSMKPLPNETTYLLEESSLDTTNKVSKLDSMSDATNAISSVPTPIEYNQNSPGLESNTQPLDYRVLFAEFLCTFLFCFLSVNTAAKTDTVGSALNNAGIVAAMAASFMPVSGAHLNPAITFALLVTKRIHWKRAVAFVPIQLLACTLASYLVKVLGTSVEFKGMAASATIIDLLRASGFEFLAMFIVTIVVFQTAVAEESEGGLGKKISCIYIGLVVLACAGGLSPAIFNPARAAGPAFIAASLHHHWVYWLGPLIGAAAAGLIAEHLFIAPAGKRKPKSILSDFFRKTSASTEHIKSLGLAGLISYGIMNTLYYGIVFSYMLARVGLASGAAGLAKAWVVTWSLSQVTKPVRLGLSVLLAPFIDRLLKARRSRSR